MKLLSTTTRVEAPFIIVNIAGFAFGKYSKRTENVVNTLDGYTRKVLEYFPNFVQSVEVTKVNGAVNTYSIQLVYAITAGDDPNKVDKILSNTSATRLLTISYGDYNSPTFIYKEEQALITSVKQNVSMQDSTITYTISAVSAVRLATAGIYSFVKRRAKPSTVLRELLRDNKKYGLKDIFYGMRNDAQVDFAGLIATDDKPVDLKAKINISIFDYMNYLVSCMTCISDGNGVEGRHKYLLQVYDDTTGELAGPYFKVIKVANNTQDVTSIDTYELDIGFPAVDMVVDFQVTTDEGYTILYNYNEKQTQGTRVYNINDKGEYDYVVTNPVLKSKTDFTPSESEKAWWAQVTQYPLQATVTIKGLLRPAMLMSYVKVNCLFYGRKSNLSGTYIITKQVDRISGDGYKSTLNLVRIMGDTL